MAYAELVCQSNFSFLTGASHPEELIRQAHQLGYSALAITDECSVAGMVRAYRVVRDDALPIKLITGSLFQYQQQRFVCLCPTHTAYRELCQLITQSRRRATKGDYDFHLDELLSCQQIRVIWLPSGEHAADTALANTLSRHFKGRVWIGICKHLVAGESRYHQHLNRLATHWKLPIVAHGHALMHSAERLPLQHTLTAIRYSKPVAELGHILLPNAQARLRPLAQIQRLYSQQWIAEAERLAQSCHFCLSELSYQYPNELVPTGLTPSQYLRQRVEEGVIKRFPNGIDTSVRTLIEKELALINEQAYEGFFLTIDDIVQFAKRRNILYQGRGSAANSVVCYCLEITAVSPDKIGMLFERFISKERNEPPDIDVDFEHQRREEVIQYIYQKYGRERTALAATVICYRRKSAIRDVGKALGMAESQLDVFISQINHRDKEVQWERQLTVLGLDAESPQAQRFVDLVNEIKGVPRHLSQHVGGFVIASGSLHDLVPIENAAMPERTVIQWDKDDLETLGLLKVDILALGMLSALQRSFDMIRQHYGHHLNLTTIANWGDDPNVYGMIQRADTIGVFQIESRAQMSMLPRLKPKTYYDLVIEIAIVRPGPIQGDMVHPYLLRRKQQQTVDYPSPDIKRVLSRTLGVPIFQEQVIELAMVAAGFSGGEADQLRRAMASWKKNGQLLVFRDKLLNGMTERGYDADYAKRIFEQICGFGEYGFPESHSASFAILAYASAWLKYYYPEAFFTALLNSWPMGFYPPAQLIQDAKRHHVQCLPVCINHSSWEHGLEASDSGWALRLGFRLVNGLSQDHVERLRSNRPANGYQRIKELLNVVPLSALQPLASANALAVLDDNRYAQRWSLMDQNHSLPLFKNDESSKQDWAYTPSSMDNMREDYGALSLSLDHHPIEELLNTGQLPSFTLAEQLSHYADRKPVTVIGLVTCRQRPSTAAGVTFLTLEDHTGFSNVVIWQATARAQQQAYLTAHLLEVTGIVEHGEGGVTHIIAGRMTSRDHLLADLNSQSRDFH